MLIFNLLVAWSEFFGVANKNLWWSVAIRQETHLCKLETVRKMNNEFESLESNAFSQ